MVFSTLKEMLAEAVAAHTDGVALRYKQDGTWRTRTYGELLPRARRVAELIGRAGLAPGDRVALFMSNSPAWAEIYFGIVGCGMVAVPVDAGLRPPEVAHILRDSGSGLLFTEAKGYPIIAEILDDQPQLKQVYVRNLQAIGKGNEPGEAFIEYDTALRGAEADKESTAFYDRHEPQAGDLASLIYTSGTTGRQKGAMLSHGNFCSNVLDAQAFAEVRPTDNFLLVLPLHHALAFTANLLLPLASGSEISFVESLRTVGENVREVHPTIIVGVPLLFQKMYDKIWANIRKNKVANTLWKIGLRKPILKSINEKLGGSLRLAVVGAAPCDPDMLRGFNRLGILMAEGYGLTEAAPILTMNPLEAPHPGTVGIAVDSVEVEIQDPNEMGIGEIIARGPNIMLGYFNNPGATEETLQNGWLMTGDMGRIDADGYLTITGRKKSLIINREGKNIYPEEVEAALVANPLIAEALVLGYQEPGDKVGERVGVIVVPDQDVLDLEAASGRALSDEEVSDRVRVEVRKASAVLSDYKRPRRVQIRSEEFERTSTQKVKRYLYQMDMVEVE